MAGAGYWAGDAIAQSIERAGDTARANATLKRQQSYHVADACLQRIALAELLKLDPSNPLLIPAVMNQIYTLAEREFWRHGWERASNFEVDPREIHSQLLSSFEVARAAAIKKAEEEPIRPHRRGWFFINRRTVFSWQGVQHPTEQEAMTTKRTELSRLRAAQLGDQLSS